MSNFSEQEIADRIGLCKSIVEGAFSIRGIGLSPEKIEHHATYWEAALAGVPTEQLNDLYEIGMRHKCTTAEQFQNVWEMKVQAEAQLAQHRQTIASRPVEPPAPQELPEEYQAFKQSARKGARR